MIQSCYTVLLTSISDKIQNKSMNFIYKNLFALPNLKPYTKHNKNLAIAKIARQLRTRYAEGI